MMTPVSNRPAHPVIAALAKIHHENKVSDKAPEATPSAKTTVTLSAAALAAAAASKEAAETPAQTAQEAGRHDQQAIRLLAKEAAAKSGN